MMSRSAFVVAAACGLSALGFGAASADEVLVVRPGVEAPHVLRVRPASPTYRYPFGVLREDYTPYGMAGVSKRDYFDVIDGRPVVRRALVRAAY